MTGDRSLSSAPGGCLDRAYPSSQKGGTLIVEEVLDLETHERRLETPDSYRPPSCPRCRARVHIHDLRPRQLVAEAAVATEVIRFRCADRGRCGAVWRILPGFLARHLRRSWSVIAGAVEEPERSTVPARTRRRWVSRLATTARLLVALLTTTSETTLCSVAAAAGLDASRHDLVARYTELTARLEADRGRSFAELAGLLHRLSPGVRLM